MKLETSKFYKNLPKTPGVYLMKDAEGEILYVGKAGNLRRRVSSYFLRPHDYRIEKLVQGIANIEYQKTETAIEALILEAELIKKHEPPFNVKEKDDTSFLYVVITKEKFPRVLLVRGKNIEGKKDSGFSSRFGPFTSATSIREALKIIRRIFPWSTHQDNANVANDKRTQRIRDSQHSRGNSLDSHYARQGRACFDYELGLCPGTCVNAISREEYMKNIRNVKLFFEGRKKKILANLKYEMAAAVKILEFEKAQKIQRQIFALQHIQDVALITDDGGQMTNDNGTESGAVSHKSIRVEGYDVSNISGTSAVGSMVVFTNGGPDKSQYRKFRIKTITGSDDVGMLTEILRRRFRRNPANGGWPLPALILIDGGVGQVNAARKVLEKFKLQIPVVGIAKGPERKKNEFIGRIPAGISENTLIRVRDEAHRFAIKYHKELRSREFIN